MKQHTNLSDLFRFCLKKEGQYLPGAPFIKSLNAAILSIQ